jgi:hypothetical protein
MILVLFKFDSVIELIIEVQLYGYTDLDMFGKKWWWLI